MSLSPHPLIPLAGAVLSVCGLASLVLAQDQNGRADQEDPLQPQAFLAEEFAPPVLLCHDGEPIKSPTGYFCPLLVDLDGDGKLDLLAGEFGHGHDRVGTVMGMGMKDKTFPFAKFFSKENSPNGVAGIGNSAYVWMFHNKTGEEGKLNFSSGQYVHTQGGGLAESPTW